MNQSERMKEYWRKKKEKSKVSDCIKELPVTIEPVKSTDKPIGIPTAPDDLMSLPIYQPHTFAPGTPCRIYRFNQWIKVSAPNS